MCSLQGLHTELSPKILSEWCPNQRKTSRKAVSKPLWYPLTFTSFDDNDFWFVLGSKIDPPKVAHSAEIAILRLAVHQIRFLDHVQTHFRPSLDQVQTNFGRSLDRVQSKQSHQVKTKFGTSLGQGWTKFRLSMEQVQTKFRPSADQVQTKFRRSD